MNPVDYIILGIVLAIGAFAAGYIIRAKKKGKKCIGCPECSCSNSCGSCPGRCSNQ